MIAVHHRPHLGDERRGAREVHDAEGVARARGDLKRGGVGEEVALLVGDLDGLVLHGHDRLDLAHGELAVSDRQDAPGTRESAGGAEFRVLLGHEQVVARLAVGTQHLRQVRGHPLGHVDARGGGVERRLRRTHEVRHLLDVGVADGVDACLGVLDGLGDAAQGVHERLERLDVDAAVNHERLLAAGTSALALTSSSTPSSSRAAATSEP